MGMIFGKIDVECASHEIIPTVTSTDFELRLYHSHVLARVPSNRAEDNEMFRILARYIGVFGTPENTAPTPQKIAMTAPVLSTPPPPPSQTIAMTAPVLSTTQQDMAFVLPSTFTRAADAPQPTDSRVELVDVEERLVAVHSFSGAVDMAGAQNVASEFKIKLEKLGYKCNDWQLARYNPPFTLWFLRTNEIWMDVVEGVEGAKRAKGDVAVPSSL